MYELTCHLVLTRLLSSVILLCHKEKHCFVQKMLTLTNRWGVTVQMHKNTDKLTLMSKYRHSKFEFSLISQFFIWCTFVLYILSSLSFLPHWLFNLFTHSRFSWPHPFLCHFIQSELIEDLPLHHMLPRRRASLLHVLLCQWRSGKLLSVWVPALCSGVCVELPALSTDTQCLSLFF